MHSIAHAKTKLILFGEHAAVYGYPAIGVALPQKITVSLKHSTGMTPENLKLLLESLPKLFPGLKKKPSFEIVVESDLPMGVGFGSSGALCVALTRALNKYLGQPDDPIQTWKIAHEMEKIFHRTPSGIDTGISVFEGLCAFEGKGGPLPHYTSLQMPKLHLIIGAIPRASTTGQLVSALRERKEKSPRIAEIIKALGQDAKEAMSLLNGIQELGLLATQAHERLKSLELSTPQLDALLNFGLSKGALGGKLSGAGGGGAYYLLAESQEEAISIAHHLQLFADAEKIEHALPPKALL